MLWTFCATTSFWAQIIIMMRTLSLHLVSSRIPLSISFYSRWSQPNFYSQQSRYLKKIQLDLLLYMVSLSVWLDLCSSIFLLSLRRWLLKHDLRFSDKNYSKSSCLQYFFTLWLFGLLHGSSVSLTQWTKTWHGKRTKSSSSGIFIINRSNRLKDRETETLMNQSLIL